VTHRSADCAKSATSTGVSLHTMLVPADGLPVARQGAIHGGSGGDGPLLERHHGERRQRAPVRLSKDRWGSSWQIIPRALIEGMNDADSAAAKRVMAR
jgi:hypothetical protein